jgi:hypothetical protein
MSQKPPLLFEAIRRHTLFKLADHLAAWCRVMTFPEPARSGKIEALLSSPSMLCYVMIDAKREWNGSGPDGNALHDAFSADLSVLDPLS